MQTSTKKNKAVPIIIFIAGIFSGVFLLAGHVHAATIVWNGAGTDNNWSTAANWTGGVAPSTGDTASFGPSSAKNAVVDVSFLGTVAGVTIGSGYAGTVSLARSLTVSGTFLQNGATFNAGSQAVTLNVFTLSAGSFTASSGTTTMNGGVTISGSPTFNANGGTVTFGSGSSTLACNNVTFNLVTFTNTAGSKIVSTGCTLPLGNNPTSSGAGGINISTGGTLSGTGTFTVAATLTLSGGTLSGFSGLSLGGLTASSTNTFAGYSSLAVSGTTTLNSPAVLTLPTAGATLATVTMNTGSTLTGSAGITIVGGVFTMNSGSTFNGNGGTLKLSSTTTIDAASTFNAQSGTVNFGGAGGGAVACGNQTFNTVTITNTGGTKVFNNCAFSLGNNPTLTATGGITLNTGTVFSGTGTLATTGTLNLNGGTLSGFSGASFPTLTTNGTHDFTAFTSFVVGSMTVNASSTVILPTAGAVLNTGLTLVSGATVTASSGETDINGTLRIGVGSTYNANGGTTFVTGNFRNDGGTFNAQSGTVNLDGTNQTILGSTTFYNLIKTTSVADILTVTAGTTQTVGGTLTLRGGNSGSLLSVVSGTPATPWTVIPQGASDLRFLNISDTKNTGSTVLAIYSNNGGGNTNIRFPATSVIVTDNLTSEDGDTGQFCIRLAAQPTGNVTIALSSSNTGEITVPSSITILPANWDTPSANCVTATGVNDLTPISDGAAQVTIVTGDVTSSDADFDALDGSTIDDVIMYNQDNDAPGVMLDVVNGVSGEDGTEAVVGFRLTSQPGGGANVTIPLSVSNTAEGSLEGVTSITILNANWNNAAANEVRIKGVDDTIEDGDAEYYLVTGDPASANAAYDSLTADDVADVSLINVDDEVQNVVITEEGGGTFVTEDGGTDTVAVNLTVQPASGKEVVVTIQPDEELDLGAGAGVAIQLAFTDSDWDTPQDITVHAVDDDDLEGDHSGTISYSIDMAATTEGNYRGVASLPQTIVHITDNDVPAPPPNVGNVIVVPIPQNPILPTPVLVPEPVPVAAPEPEPAGPTSVPENVCTPYITKYIQAGSSSNDPAEVTKLQTFLNEKEGEHLPVDGVYSSDDVTAVKRFQQKYASEILDVWGLSQPTGYVYRTTILKINSFNCDSGIICPAFTEYNSLTKNPVSEEVLKTKTLLNELGFYNGPLNTVFDKTLDSSLKKFQETFSATMLKPWGLTKGTGYKYKTTDKFFNMMVGCDTPAVHLEGVGSFDY